jgi:hypothetical protein
VKCFCNAKNAITYI